MQFLRPIVIMLLLTNIIIGQVQNSTEITVNELREQITFLASDSLKGRKPGTKEGKIAAEYIRENLTKNHITLLGENGFQFFDVITSISAGENNTFKFLNTSAVMDSDFVPLSLSASDNFQGKAVFVGYGFNIKNDSINWNDYESVDLNNKWAIILRGNPEPDNPSSDFETQSAIRKKVLLATDNGAKGVIFVSGVKFDSDDELSKLSIDRGDVTVSIPVLQIKRKIADNILAEFDISIEDLESSYIQNKKPNSFEIESIISARTDLIKNKVETQNVIGLIEGSDPDLKNEYIVLGGHYDHLGMGGPGSGSRRPDTIAIHNGADDNASGSSAIMEIIEKIAGNRDQFKRSIIFAAFGAEEMGLLGSKFFTDNPPVELSNIKFMFNLDMIGRLDTSSNKLTVGGTGTGQGLERFIDETKAKYNIATAYSPEGLGPSDHASFYAKDIPVLFFWTGAHDLYHTPFDDVEIINMEGLKSISDFAYDLIFNISNREKSFVFQEAGPKSRPDVKRRFKVTLGIMPDHAATDVKGMAVGAVIPERPAAKAGMKKGDVIVNMEGKSVENIYDYMYRLGEFSPGQRISVEVMRDNQKIVLIVEL